MSGCDPRGHGGAPRTRVGAARCCAPRLRRVLGVLGSLPLGVASLSAPFRGRPRPGAGEPVVLAQQPVPLPGAAEDPPLDADGRRLVRAPSPGEKRGAQSWVEVPPQERTRRRTSGSLLLGAPGPNAGSRDARFCLLWELKVQEVFRHQVTGGTCRIFFFFCFRRDLL